MDRFSDRSWLDKPGWASKSVGSKWGSDHSPPFPLIALMKISQAPYQIGSVVWSPAPNVCAILASALKHDWRNPSRTKRIREVASPRHAIEFAFKIGVKVDRCDACSHNNAIAS
ncbi:MAG: hypothetical protein ACYC96_14825 [Fimbriimonadaceae bacterium]